jgi:hypothetical protein
VLVLVLVQAVDEMAEKLDGLMLLLFEYLDQVRPGT